MVDNEHWVPKLEQLFHEGLERLSVTLVQNSDCHASTLLSSDIQIQRLANDFKAKSKYFSEHCTQGLELCLLTLHELASIDAEIQVHEVASSLKQAFCKLDSAEIAHNFALQVVQGSSWKNLLEIPTFCLEHLYKAAKHLYSSRRFQDAESAFSYLVLLDHWQYCFWLGLAHASRKNQNYLSAIHGYKAASKLSPQTLWLYLFQIDCLIALKDFQSARTIIHTASKFQDRAFHEELRKRERLL